ncbi:MAG: hypothetical protein NVS4B3_07080 [Gemmatimonadaceae bacterium]
MEHPMRAYPSNTSRRVARNRRGSALLLTLLMTVALSAMAMSAIFLSSTSLLIAKHGERERELRYVAEAALAMGKSRINTDSAALPDTGIRQIMSGAVISGADGQPIPGVTANVWVGPSGNISGQFGRFASVVAQAQAANGASFVRRLELTQDTFAKYAYWTNLETAVDGSPIYFGGGDNLWGPVWSNDAINIYTSGATFHDDVGTAQIINGQGYGTFLKAPLLNQQPINLPSTAKLATLASRAGASLSFTAPTTGDETTVLMRVEFVAVDLNGDGNATDQDEGFIRVYTAQPVAGPTWLRGDSVSAGSNCGDYHAMGVRGLKFFPASVHTSAAFRDTVANANGGVPPSDFMLTVDRVLADPGARCYPGGDPRLVASERGIVLPGDTTTFTAVGTKGSWTAWTGPIDPRVQAARPWDYKYLIPLYRGLNSTSQGVIYVVGTTAVSGKVRSKATLYAKGTIVVIDDIRYSVDPASAQCTDILGLIADNDVVIADNAMNSPYTATDASGAAFYKSLDDTPDVWVDGFAMSLNTSWRAENYASGPPNIATCSGAPSGRGCLYLTGGLIQQRRGPVGTTAITGYTKRYTYDRCAQTTPPPYFPTTGQFKDNRFYEVDPANLDIRSLFRTSTP